MGSLIEINDTLRITAEQGFPAELDLATHLKNPYKLEAVAGKTFSFQSKPEIRVYQLPPERNFLVQEIDDKWVYWGLCIIHSISHDYIKKETSGTFEIISLNTPEAMQQAFSLINIKSELNYFQAHV